MANPLIPATPYAKGLSKHEFQETFELHKQRLADQAALDVNFVDSGANLAANVVILPGATGQTQHKDISPDNVHVPHSWQVGALSGLDSLSVGAEDVGKLARVNATNEYYTLTESSPKTWEKFNGTPGTAAPIAQLSYTNLLTVFSLSQEYSIELGRLPVPLQTVTVSSSTTLFSRSQLVEVDSSGGNVDINLPPGTATADPWLIVIGKISSDTNRVRVYGNGSLIKTETFVDFTLPGNFFEFRRVGPKWIV